jgi:ketosteroid isomerase-like protein
MAHRNLEMLKKIDAAFGTGNVEEIFSYFADDVLAHISGKSSLAGDHRGKDKLMALFGRYMAALGEAPVVETHAQLADDDHGVQLQTLHAEKGGRTLDVKNITIYHFREGKVSEMWSVDDDPYAADAFYDA